MATDLVQRVRTRIGARHVRSGLLRAARDYARHGWPVLPGAWWSPEIGRHVCDAPGCVSSGLHPGSVDTAATTMLGPPTNLCDFALLSEHDIRSRWRDHPYAVLMPTGLTCDVVELTATTAAAIWPHESLTSLHTPVSIVSRSSGSRSADHSDSLHDTSSVFIFTQTGETISPDTLDELARHRVVLHRRGSWVPLPPSRVSGHTTQWIVAPDDCGWQTPPLAQLSHHILRRLVQLRSASLPAEHVHGQAA